MTDKINFFAEQMTKQLMEAGLTPEDILTVFVNGVITLTPFVHPAGFDVQGKIHNLSVESILAEHNPTELH